VSEFGPSRVSGFIGALLILSIGGISHAATPAEASLVGAVYVVQSVQAAADPEDTGPGTPHGWLALMVGLAAAGYSLRRGQRSLESRQPLVR
jgi:hypothetical protein